MVAVLYDGWPLVYRPNGAAALHLLTLLAYHPKGVEALVALPGEGPNWLKERGKHEIAETPDSAQGRLAWEQARLPKMQKRLGAAALHLTRPGGPLFSGLDFVVSSTENIEAVTGSRELKMLDRLRESLGYGAAARAKAVFWPEDLPLPFHPGPAPLVQLPSVVHPAFVRWQGARADQRGLGLESLELPEEYILYHGPEVVADLHRLLQAWSWAAGPVGRNYPLLAAGFSSEGASRFSSLAREYNLEESVRVLPVVSPEALANIYRAASAIFHPAPLSLWGGAVRLGLAMQTPVVGIESLYSDAVVGDAGILREAEDPRGLGAALLTVIVEESVAQGLVEAAKRKNPGRNAPEFSERLQAAYLNLSGKST